MIAARKLLNSETEANITKIYEKEKSAQSFQHLQPFQLLQPFQHSAPDTNPNNFILLLLSFVFMLASRQAPAPSVTKA